MNERVDVMDKKLIENTTNINGIKRKFTDIDELKNTFDEFKKTTENNFKMLTNEILDSFKKIKISNEVKLVNYILFVSYFIYLIYCIYRKSRNKF